MELNRPQNPLLLGFITLSLLLHLVLLYLLPQWSLFPVPSREEPVYVEMRPTVIDTEKIIPPKEEAPITVPEDERVTEKPKDLVKRIGPEEHKVEKEVAPKGDFWEDRIPETAPPKPKVETPPEKISKPQEKSISPPKNSTSEAKPIAPGVEGKALSPPQQTAPESIKAPSLESLLTLPSNTIARLEDEWRVKYRDEVEKGNAVWLDTETDLLFSFFERFKSKIYGVWNYPHQSAERGEQGTCLLKITVKKDGTLEDVKLIESSGHPELDKAALAAVRKGGPYGKVHRFYEKEELTIFVFFQYNLSRRVIY